MSKFTTAYRMGREDYLYPSEQRSKSPFPPDTAEHLSYLDGKNEAAKDLASGAIKLERY